ncbi:MAG TPA: nitrous oxide reductase accessory protein NosL [Syntrophorhabdales bacterium]|nr:nitrous oxide reductase accessory protein NosL [Syntrophorhabdales bacterium]
MRTTLSIVFTLCIIASSFAAGAADMMHSQKERCAVCGMPTAMFPKWISKIEFKDGTNAIFDGPKDMFKYYLDVKKYNPQKRQADITAISVKDYYSGESINAQNAFYIIWSDVLGPMGHQLVPFEKEADAKKFLNEHKGKEIVRFKDVNMKLITSLDNPP